MARRRLNENNYIIFLIDSSISMKGQKEAAALEGLMEKTHAVMTESVNADEQGLKTLVGLWSFNNNVTEHYSNTNGLQLENLTAEQYRCAGSTAIYDAVKTAVDWFKENTDVNDERNSYLIELITDGGENASTCDKLALARELVEFQKSGRWTVAITGNDSFGLTAFAEALRVPRGNVAAYDAQSADGTRLAYRETAGKLRGFMKGRTEGVKSMTSFHSNQDGVAADYKDIKPMEPDEDAFERYSGIQPTGLDPNMSIDDLLAQAHNLVDQLPDVLPEAELRDRADKWLKGGK